MSKVEHHVHVVLDQQDGELSVQLRQELRHLQRLAGRQARRRLVEKKNARVAREPEHDLELALLAVREIANLGVRAIGETGLFEQLVRLGVNVSIR